MRCLACPTELNRDGQCICSADNQYLVEAGDSFTCLQCDSILWDGPRSTPSYECRQCLGDTTLAGNICIPDEDVPELPRYQNKLRVGRSYTTSDTFK